MSSGTTRHQARAVGATSRRDPPDHRPQRKGTEPSATVVELLDCGLADIDRTLVEVKAAQGSTACSRAAGFSRSAPSLSVHDRTERERKRFVRSVRRSGTFFNERERDGSHPADCGIRRKPAQRPRSSLLSASLPSRAGGDPGGEDGERRHRGRCRRRDCGSPARPTAAGWVRRGRYEQPPPEPRRGARPRHRDHPRRPP